MKGRRNVDVMTGVDIAITLFGSFEAVRVRIGALGMEWDRELGRECKIGPEKRICNESE